MTTFLLVYWAGGNFGASGALAPAAFGFLAPTAGAGGAAAGSTGVSSAALAGVAEAKFWAKPVAGQTLVSTL